MKGLTTYPARVFSISVVITPNTSTIASITILACIFPNTRFTSTQIARLYGARIENARQLGGTPNSGESEAKPEGWDSYRTHH